ncbi:hypothetical protein IPL85_02510 [Candidatus Saccharibacteria bacterium]|nr:MAG: hypothetical protein IPL85_02510 [Candidatus Saccharibacteria bacterium]
MSETNVSINNLDPTLYELSEAQLAAVKLFELPDKEFEDALPGFVEQRIAQLSEGVSRDTVTGSTPPFSTFIPPDRPLFPAEDVIDQQPFLLDDPNAYQAAIARVRSSYLHRVLRQDKSPNVAKAFLNAAVWGTFEAQALYFGSYYGSTMERLNKLEQKADTLRNVSVSELGDSAMCMERAGIVHNSLMLLGVPTEYFNGKLKKYDNEGKLLKIEGHAYLIVEGTAGAKYLYDPANPKLTEYLEQGVSKAAPNVKKIVDGEADTVVIPWQRVVRSGGGEDVMPAGEWHYISNTSFGALGRMAMM